MKLAKYEPEDGKCLVFVGQELEAIGGLEDYNEGYLDHFEKPAGFTMYTGLSVDVESFGFMFKGLDGVFTTDDWGDSYNNMSLQIMDEDFNGMALAIGLWMTGGNEVNVANGERDSLINKMGDWIKTLAPRPVFLRIGYEFLGPWNNYDREGYLTAYKRIKDKLDAMAVNNVAYVWQSHGFDEPHELLELWYPGDEYVDWCGFSFFNRWDEQRMISFARKKGKPVFIAEASATLPSPTVKTTGLSNETLLTDPDQAQQAWSGWFTPFFKTIEDNEDVVKAISYINCHWKSHRMWYNNPTFKNIDARLQTSDFISKKWKEKMNEPRFIHASDFKY